MSPAEVISTRSEDDTAAVAARLASTLTPGSVVLLFGDLGAGKTAFVRGMAEGLGIDPDEVSSPTFTLIQEYRAPGATPVLYHVDLYRLEAAEIDDLGLDELTSLGGIAAIEWAEKLARPPAGAVRVSLTDPGDDTRTIEITRAPDSYSDR